MSRPACRGCYAETLTDAERERFNAEPVTSCIHLCERHKPAINLTAQISAWPGWVGLRVLGDHGSHRGKDRES